MRAPLSLLIVASLLLTSVLLVSRGGVAPSQTPEGFPGPHLAQPNPDVYDYMPFRQYPPILNPVGRTRGPLTTDVLVLLVEFQDVTHGSAHTPAYVSGLVNGNSQGNLRHYYDDVSYGHYLLQGDIGGNKWYKSASPLSRYGADSTTGVDDYNGPVYNLVREAVQLANADVDFSSYDHDSDGVVDHLVIVHAGEGQESSGRVNDIWSHRWAVVSPSLMVDGVRVYTYTMISESSPIGVIAHEFGHDLGLPDLYDTDKSSIGAGLWDIMATGSWAGIPRGSSPAHLSAWCKAKLGWIVPTDVTAPRYSQDITAVETTPVAFKLSIRESGTSEYFLIENREKVGYDSSMPGEGLLIWHVDESVSNNDNDGHRLLGLVEADAAGGDSPDDAGDAWASNVAGFTPDSFPSSNGYGNARTGWKVRNIGAAGTTMTADISKEVDDDLAVLDMQNAKSVAVSTTVSVRIEIANMGARNQTNFPVSISVFRGGHEPSQKVTTSNVTRTLNAKTYSNFTWTYTPTVQGRYIVEVDAVLPRDEIPENNQRLTHFNAVSSYFYDDVELGNKGWTASPTGESHQWQMVQEGGPYGDSLSPAHSWRLGYFGPGNTSSRYSLESVDISFNAGPLYLSFFHRDELMVRSDLPVPATDYAFVNVSFNGQPWINLPGGRFNGTNPDWSLFYANLTSYASSSGTMRVRFESTAGNMPQDGGWWIDDIFVSSYSFGYAVGVLPVAPIQTVEPGSKASFIFKVVNLGDFIDNVMFLVSSGNGWVVVLSYNTTQSAPETLIISLKPDREATLTLIVQTPGDVTRGTEATFTLTARSQARATSRDSFNAVVIINDPLGLGRLSRYFVLFFVVFIVLVAIALIIDNVKRKRGIR